MACVGSVALAEQAPTPESTDNAREGTAFHHFAAELLKGRYPALGAIAPNDYILDAEMLAHARDYAALLKSDPSWTARVEAPLHWGPGGKAHDGQPWQVRVKCDCITWRPDISTLAVTDAKYGFRYVDAADNWQLLSQAIGACFWLNIQPQRIILAIYQPRTSGEALRHVEITANELLHAYQQLCTRLDNLTSDLTTGPHCRYCPAAAGCPAIERATYNAIDVAMNSGQFSVRPETFASELELLGRASELLKQRYKWIESVALADLRAGKPVPGLATRNVLGQTAWATGAVDKLRELQGANQKFIEEVPVTPAEAKRRGLSEEDYKALTYRPLRGVALVSAPNPERAFK